MKTSIRLPEKKHFKSNGIFSHSHLRVNKPLPVEILNYVFPGYISRNVKTIKKKQLEMVEDYCIYIKKLAQKEEREQKRLNKIKLEEELEKKKNEFEKTVLDLPKGLLGGMFFKNFSSLYNLKNVNSK
jgi:hypothetical protein